MEGGVAGGKDTSAQSRYRSGQEAVIVSPLVDHYHIWVDLRPGDKDIEFSDALRAMLEHMQGEGMIEAYSVQRRKLGFGPDGLGEWHVDITTRDLAQLDAAFHAMAPRSGKLEKLHAAVWSKVTNYKAGLYRDFPDAERK